MKRLEAWFEGALWGSRYVVIAAVVSSLFAAIAIFYMATVDAFYMLMHMAEYASSQLDGAARSHLRGESITHVVEMVDGYLLATVLLIFALGLYELFISKIDQAQGDETSFNVLLIENLDDLKNRLAKVILMILIVKYFENAIEMRFDSALNLFYLASGILLIGLAIYITHGAEHPGKANKPAKHG